MNNLLCALTLHNQAFWHLASLILFTFQRYLGRFPMHVRITKYARVSTTYCECICMHCSNPKPNPPPLRIYLLYSLHREGTNICMNRYIIMSRGYLVHMYLYGPLPQQTQSWVSLQEVHLVSDNNSRLR